MDESNNDAGHESAALLRLIAVMRCEALQPRIVHGLFYIITVSHWHRCQSHKRAIAIIISISWISIILLLLEVLINRNGDVSAKSDGALPAAVVKALIEPESEHVPDVLGVEKIVVEEDAVRHAETHRGVVSPNPDLAVSALQYAALNGLVDIFQTSFDHTKATLSEWYELSASAKRITDGHAENSSNSS